LLRRRGEEQTLTLAAQDIEEFVACLRLIAFEVRSLQCKISIGRAVQRVASQEDVEERLKGSVIRPIDEHVVDAVAGLFADAEPIENLERLDGFPARGGQVLAEDVAVRGGEGTGSIRGGPKGIGAPEEPILPVGVPEEDVAHEHQELPDRQVVVIVIREFEELSETFLEEWLLEALVVLPDRTALPKVVSCANTLSARLPSLVSKDCGEEAAEGVRCRCPAEAVYLRESSRVDGSTRDRRWLGATANRPRRGAPRQARK
jgi:hypothetical protein